VATGAVDCVKIDQAAGPTQPGKPPPVEVNLVTWLSTQTLSCVASSHDNQVLVL
jgi:hypothetical protein